MAFFNIAAEGGFVVNKVLEETMEKAMFEEDPGVSLHPYEPQPDSPGTTAGTNSFQL